MLHLSCGIWNLVPWPGIKPGLLHWEYGVLATGPLGKSPKTSYFNQWILSVTVLEFNRKKTEVRWRECRISDKYLLTIKKKKKLVSKLKLLKLRKGFMRNINEWQLILFVCFDFILWHVGSLFPNHGSNSHPLQWKCSLYHWILQGHPSSYFKMCFNFG